MNISREPKHLKKNSRRDIRLKLVFPLCTILMVLLTASTLLVFAGPRRSFAIVVDSGNCGLVVETSDVPVDTGNLNPGDTKASYLIAKNTKETPLNYWFNIEMTSRSVGFYPGLEGRSLDEVLQITVKRSDAILFHGLVSEFVELDMGKLAGNAEERIDIIAYLDGPGVGNEYQGAGVAVVFKFRSECDAGATLTVRKFRDDNRNGIWDSGEAEIRNWKVTINGVEYYTPVISLDVAAGTYTIIEETRDGWSPSTPARVEVTLEQGDHGVVLFGNYPSGGDDPDGAALTVRKFHDLGGSGTWDAGEPEIQGWPVTINGQEYTTPVILSNLGPGDYRVAEELREGWEPTTLAEAVVTLQEGESKSVYFGNRQEGMIIIPPELPELELTVDPLQPALPRTGELPPYYYYTAGALLVLAGILLEKRRRSIRTR